MVTKNVTSIAISITLISISATYFGSGLYYLDEPEVEDAVVT